MIKATLTDYQVEAVAKLVKMKRRILCGDTGSGKTCVLLAVVDFLRHNCGLNEIVVACPKSAIPTWKREIAKHSDLTASFGDYDQRKDMSVMQFNQFGHNFVPKRSPSCLLIDEAHMLSSATSEQATRFRGGVLKGMHEKVEGIMSHFDYVYGATATPLLNHIEDFYYIVDSFFPNYFGTLESFLTKFTKRVEKQIYRKGGGYVTIDGRQSWNPDGGYIKIKEIVSYLNLDHLAFMTEPVMSRIKMDYKIEFYNILGELSADELHQYRKAGKGMLHGSERDFAARLPDLQKVVNGSVDLDGNYRSDNALSSKEVLLVDVLNKIATANSGCVVFTSYLDTMQRFHKLESQLKFSNVFYMTGDTPVDERGRIAKAFGQNDVLFATKVGGISLNLQACNNVVFMDIPWSVGDVLQACGRITRMDSKFPVMNVMNIIASDTIDTYKQQMLSSNLHLMKAIMSGFGFVEGQFAPVKKASIAALRRSLLWSKV